MSGHLIHRSLTEHIIKAFYKVYNTLGYGFLEKVYENALAIELDSMGLRVRQQQPIKVYYGGRLVGDYFADVVVEGAVIIELKVADAICERHETQLLNYLKATEVEVGLLLNFGPKAEFRRKVFANEKKRIEHKQNPRESA
ncbi:MAG TPA: GxxExxY protein [Blastocatellia bacterium]|nr:GxxExxY protein [Blastocatellia bacterium]